MNTLPKDVTVEIALNLKPADLVKFCSVNRKTNSRICDSKDFWRRKLVKDYPEEMKEIEDTVLDNPKKIYMQRFRYISAKIEEFIEQMISIIFEDFEKFLNDKYRKHAFDILYDLYGIFPTLMSRKLDEYPNEEVRNLTLDVFFNFTGDFFPPDMHYERERLLDDLVINLIADFSNVRIKDILKNEI